MIVDFINKKILEGKISKGDLEEFLLHGLVLEKHRQVF